MSMRRWAEKGVEGLVSRHKRQNGASCVSQKTRRCSLFQLPELPQPSSARTCYVSDDYMSDETGDLGRKVGRDLDRIR